jgi:hypothetical protein
MPEKESIMNMYRQIILKVFLGLSLVGLLTGCATIPKEKIVNSTTDYNVVLEKAENEMLLLNVVRGSKRHPMYFTTLSDIKGSMLVTLNGTMSIPFVNIQNVPGISYSISPGVTYTNNPIFDVVPLTTKEFTQGILTAVPPETFYYYWQQGWQPEMLLNLFIKSMETSTVSYPNYNPQKSDHNKAFAEFQNKLREIKDCKLSTEELSDPIGPEINVEDAANLKQLVEAQKAELTLKKTINDSGHIKYQLKSPKKIHYYFECKNPDRIIEFSDTVCKWPTKADDKSVGTLCLRSAEAMLYFLGQIMRKEEIENYTTKIEEECEGSKQSLPLFVARKATADDKNPQVAVDYEGTKYVIPRLPGYDAICPSDESMHVLSLIALLIAKQTATQQLPPPTGVVTTIGR